jgi:hypothetical protein
MLLALMLALPGLGLAEDDVIIAEDVDEVVSESVEWSLGEDAEQDVPEQPVIATAEQGAEDAAVAYEHHGLIGVLLFYLIKEIIYSLPKLHHGFSAGIAVRKLAFVLKESVAESMLPLVDSVILLDESLVHNNGSARSRRHSLCRGICSNHRRRYDKIDRKVTTSLSKALCLLDSLFIQRIISSSLHAVKAVPIRLSVTGTIKLHNSTPFILYILIITKYTGKYKVKKYGY